MCLYKQPLLLIQPHSPRADADWLLDTRSTLVIGQWAAGRGLPRVNHEQTALGSDSVMESNLGFNLTCRRSTG